MQYFQSLRALAITFCLSPFLLISQTWSPVGSGAASTVYALEEFNGDLFAGGLFTEIGGVSVNYLARWNGTDWSSIGGLITFMAADGLYANDTALFIGDGGRVRWLNTGSLQNLTGVSSSSFNSTAYSLAHFENSLYVGGVFSSPFARIAKWNGSAYSSVTSGCNAQVNALEPFEGQLFVGGNFTLAGDSAFNRTALWNGTEWNRMGEGVNDDVFTHCYFQDTLYIGGRFTMANGQTTSKVAKWNGSQWVKVGNILNDHVTAMAVYRDELYIGGSFTTPSYIARLSGQTWVPVGSGVNNKVKTLEVYHDSLFVGGEFTMAGGIPANKIAKWYQPAAPQAGFTPELPLLCVNQCTGFLDSSTNDPLTYSWSFPGGTPATSEVPNPFICYSSPGIYLVTLTVSNAAGTNSTTQENAITVEICTGIEEWERRDFTISPNPAHGQFTITLNQPAQHAALDVLDATGRSIERHTISGKTIQLSTNALAPGTYMVRLSTAAQGERSVERLVVE